ncbi:hypothetical protein [Candidatus Synchoanobacter obligatus]|uniref:Uncharacterized protein n=1 Tax=Candidatus Synchoanobacter obligatus TaxID=2919597 RepID=A0ABT1L5S6_9GAMM|nr:hypothetical protein [Candidatus Synchoanobacter obligatus]MCP8352535.1 hypothetical protein [Candidatus Synchoanobacter obligatus]
MYLYYLITFILTSLRPGEASQAFFFKDTTEDTISLHLLLTYFLNTLSAQSIGKLKDLVSQQDIYPVQMTHTQNLLILQIAYAHNHATSMLQKILSHQEDGDNITLHILQQSFLHLLIHHLTFKQLNERQQQVLLTKLSECSSSNAVAEVFGSDLLKHSEPHTHDDLNPDLSMTDFGGGSGEPGFQLLSDGSLVDKRLATGSPDGGDEANAFNHLLKDLLIRLLRFHSLYYESSNPNAHSLETAIIHMLQPFGSTETQTILIDEAFALHERAIIAFINYRTGADATVATQIYHRLCGITNPKAQQIEFANCLILPGYALDQSVQPDTSIQQALNHSLTQVYPAIPRGTSAVDWLISSQYSDYLSHTASMVFSIFNTLLAPILLMFSIVLCLAFHISIPTACFTVIGTAALSLCSQYYTKHYIIPKYVNHVRSMHILNPFSAAAAPNAEVTKGPTKTSWLSFIF